MFFKKNTVVNIFDRYYNRMLKIAKSSLYPNSKFELLPAMYVVSDLATLNSGKDRKISADNILKDFIRYHTNDGEKFNKRCSLYGEIVRGLPIRFEWFLGDIYNINDHSVTRCAYCLLDILYNPICADDYENAPFNLLAITDTTLFMNNVAVPLIEQFVQFYNDIYKL